MKEGLTEIGTEEIELFPTIFYQITFFKRSWENCLPRYEANARAINPKDLHRSLKTAWESCEKQEDLIPELKKIIKNRIKIYNIKISHQINIFEDANH